jgi:hypothetical protein
MPYHHPIDMAGRVPKPSPLKLPVVGKTKEGGSGNAALPAYQGSPRSRPRDQTREIVAGSFKLDPHGWSPEDWVPIEKRREDWYPVRIGAAPKSPFSNKL